MVNFEPLASRLRPQSLKQFVGQEHLLAKDKPLYQALTKNQLHSFILWGPSGVGKTTLAQMMAQYTDAEFVSLSAVLAGVKDIRAVMDVAQQRQQLQSKKTILFVDEVHRFNKAQQDAFLPYIEQGTVTFIGATTENPSFELNNALLSRARVYVLKPLTIDNITQIIHNACDKQKVDDKSSANELTDKQIELIAKAADGDARRALNSLEMVFDIAVNQQIDDAQLLQLLGDGNRRFDKGGDQFYDQISALHKSVRGSDPDAALYWLCRMLDGGCEPLYLARRLIRMAAEDIGNADPRALNICNEAALAYERLGSPEGELVLAQATVYLAIAAKSNAVYSAFNQIRATIAQQPSYEVPKHLRNAPTSLMKSLDYSKNYRYAHNEDQGFAAGENYFPNEFPQVLQQQGFYHPVDRGLEQKIKAKMQSLKQLNQQSKSQ